MYSLFLFLSVESKSKVLHLTIVSTHQIQEIFNLPDKNKSFNVWDMIFWTMLSKVTMPAFLLMDKQVSNKESDMKKNSHSLEKSSNRPMRTYLLEIFGDYELRGPMILYRRAQK